MSRPTQGNIPLIIAIHAARTAGKLTDRQHDTLRLWLHGYGTRRIATTLELSEPTVREHLRRARDNIRPYLQERDA